MFFDSESFWRRVSVQWQSRDGARSNSANIGLHSSRLFACHGCSKKIKLEITFCSGDSDLTKELIVLSTRHRRIFQFIKCLSNRGHIVLVNDHFGGEEHINIASRSRDRYLLQPGPTSSALDMIS